MLDPVQHALIAAHLTLGREDELDDVAGLHDRLRDAPPPPLELTFGPAESSTGHGVLLPCTSGAGDFAALRAAVLDRHDLRIAHPHLTLAHPRNPRAPGNDIALAHQLPSPHRIRFDTISLIEQREGAPWRTLWTVPLQPNA